VLGVPVEVRVELGRKLISVGELLTAAPGHVVMFDRLVDSGVDVYAADRLLGGGHVVVIDEEFGVRVTELYDGTPSADGED
jgi:flagellar motor switch protein FliN/FliY